jgi:hypothetical protein
VPTTVPGPAAVGTIGTLTTALSPAQPPRGFGSGYVTFVPPDVTNLVGYSSLQWKPGSALADADTVHGLPATGPLVGPVPVDATADVDDFGAAESVALGVAAATDVVAEGVVAVVATDDADFAGVDEVEAVVVESLPAAPVDGVPSPHAARQTHTTLINTIFWGELVSIRRSLVDFSQPGLRPARAIIARRDRRREP